MAYLPTEEGQLPRPRRTIRLWRPKSGNLNARYMLMGTIDDPQDYDSRLHGPGLKGNEPLAEAYLEKLGSVLKAPRVYLVDADHPSISTTAFRADEIEEVT